MADDFERLLETIRTIFPENKVIQEQLNRIEMKSAFRAPELEHLTWNELAHFLKTLQVDQLALFLAAQSKAIYFNDGEIRELQRALSKHVTNIHKFIESDKTTAQDKAELTIWLENTRTAIEKINK